MGGRNSGGDGQEMVWWIKIGCGSCVGGGAR